VAPQIKQWNGIQTHKKRFYASVQVFCLNPFILMACLNVQSTIRERKKPFLRPVNVK
jgi:hypothetical protein